MLLKKSDLVSAIGYDPIEYEACNWEAEIDTYYQPERELIGDIAQTLENLIPAIRGYKIPEGSIDYLDGLHELLSKNEFDRNADPNLVHPLDFIDVLQDTVKDDETVTVDVGSHYIWMARNFKSYEPRHLLFSNGMQTLGVALPWGISAALLRPGKKVYSISGDGGFLFSAQELETAVRLNLPLIHIIWNDGHYNMVEFQEVMKYGRASGVDFGPVDFVKYAEAFGAKGIRVTNKADLAKALLEIEHTTGPVVIDVPIDYKDNIKLGETILPDEFY